MLMIQQLYIPKHVQYNDQKRMIVFLKELGHQMGWDIFYMDE